MHPTRIENNSAAPVNVQGNDLMQVLQICSELAKSPFYAKMGTGGVMAVWLTAKELGIPPMSALNGGLYTFDGKVTLSAQLMNMMIINAGHRIDIVELHDRTCKLTFWRKDRMKDPKYVGFSYEFSVEMAQKAGYMNKTNWKNHTRDMLFSRALSGGARKHLPDALMNCYVFGEIEDGKFNDSDLVNVMPTEVVNHANGDAPPIAIEQKISNEEVEEIISLLEVCDFDFIDRIVGFCRTKQKMDSSVSFCEMVPSFTPKFYGTIKKRIIDEIEKQRKFAESEPVKALVTKEITEDDETISSEFAG